jgi:hypothetical protein
MKKIECWECGPKTVTGKIMHNNIFDCSWIRAVVTTRKLISEMKLSELTTELGPGLYFAIGHF